MNDFKYNIGYLDEEELWQAQAMQRFGTEFNVKLIEIPISLSDIWTFIVDNELDAMIVDFRLFESGQVTYDGAQVISEIIKHNEHFPMFIMTSYENNAVEQSENVLIIRGKDVLTDDELFEKFSQVLKASISSYRKKVEKAKTDLLEIAQKIRTGGQTTPADDAIRFNAELFLSQINKDNSMPMNLNSMGHSQQMEKMLDMTKDLLKKLKDK
ncbi:MAG: hypothetical protein ACK5KV_08135 [Bacteroides graminisolvens]|uniref:hypothetical protein n=1 Tax=Bacteroides graminisolvens TaxID=477666 RepID=UPI003A846C6A